MHFRNEMAGRKSAFLFWLFHYENLTALFSGWSLKMWRENFKKTVGDFGKISNHHEIKETLKIQRKWGGVRVHLKISLKFSIIRGGRSRKIWFFYPSLFLSVQAFELFCSDICMVFPDICMVLLRYSYGFTRTFAWFWWDICMVLTPIKQSPNVLYGCIRITAPD